MINNIDFWCVVFNGSMEVYICIIFEFVLMMIWFDCYMIIFWYCLGIIGNFFIIKIWLICVSWINILVLYFIVFVIMDLFYLLLYVIQELKFVWGFVIIDIEGWCQIYFVFYMFVMYMSLLLIFGFIIECFLFIIYFFKSQRFFIIN